MLFFSVGQEFRNGLARWFWLWVSHEVAVKILTRAQLWNRGVCFQDGLNRAAKLVLAVVRTQLLSMRPLPGLLGCLQDTEARFSQIKWLVRENMR